MKTIIAAGGLVLNEHNELLMMYRRGKWDLPKGKLDEGETIAACAVREVEEETGVAISELGKLIEVSTHQYFDKWLDQEVLKETHWFAMKANSDQPLIPQAEEDIEQLKWVKGKELQECLTNSYDNIINLIKKAGI